jgi:hypothetical protein
MFFRVSARVPKCVPLQNALNIEENFIVQTLYTCLIGCHPILADAAMQQQVRVLALAIASATATVVGAESSGSSASAHKEACEVEGEEKGREEGAVLMLWCLCCCGVYCWAQIQHYLPWELQEGRKGPAAIAATAAVSP